MRIKDWKFYLFILVLARSAQVLMAKNVVSQLRICSRWDTAAKS